MIIRKYTPKDAKKVCYLINSAFDEFVAHDFTKAGKKTFKDQQIPKKQNERAKKRDIYVAEKNKRIIGIVEAAFPGKVNRLFVDKRYHGQNIGTALMKKIEQAYKKKGSREIKVNSSRFAVGFYQKLGYKKTMGLIHHKNGFVYQPMKKTLAS